MSQPWHVPFTAVLARSGPPRLPSRISCLVLPMQRPDSVQCRGVVSRCNVISKVFRILGKGVCRLLTGEVVLGCRNLSISWIILLAIDTDCFKSEEKFGDGLNSSMIIRDILSLIRRIHWNLMQYLRYGIISSTDNFTNLCHLEQNIRQNLSN